MTRNELRQSIARNLKDLELATVTSMSSSNIRADALKRLADDYFNDGQVYVYAGTGAGEAQFISDFAKTNGEITPLGTWGTAPVANDSIEVRRGDGLVVADYHDAIDQAYAELEDIFLTDKLSEALTMEQHRHEYSIPSGWRYLSSVEYVLPVRNLSSSAHDTDLGINISAGTVVRSQAFKLSSDTLITSIRLYLRSVGTISPARTITIYIDSDNDGEPGGDLASVTMSTSGVVASPAFYSFVLSTPLMLQSDTRYHILITVSGAIDATNYIAWCADTDQASADGDALSGTDPAGTLTWTVVSGTTMILSVIPAVQSRQYVALPNNAWRVIRSDKLVQIDTVYDGAGIRLVGQGQATALSADTDESTVPEGFVIAQATAILLPQLNNRKHDQRDIKALLNYYQQRAEALRLRARVQPRPNSHVVDLR